MSIKARTKKKRKLENGSISLVVAVVFQPPCKNNDHTIKCILHGVQFHTTLTPANDRRQTSPQNNTTSTLGDQGSATQLAPT